MCGICGLIARNGTTLDPKDVERMTAAIRHRGPDDEGYVFVDAARGKAAAFKGDDSVPEISLPHLKTLAGQDFAVGFGFRRLSILDLSAAGHQPMASEDGRRWIVFNGEVYNYVELRHGGRARGLLPLGPRLPQPFPRHVEPVHHRPGRTGDIRGP
jgi:asparagine synthase (glutamine-hydrolysing)